jgi:uncharacterized protein (DUF1800 family)
MASLNPIKGELGLRRAAHLLRRTSFRYTRQQVDALAKMTAADALKTLLQPAPLQLEQPVYAAKASDKPVTWINPPQPPGTRLPADDSMVLRRYVMAWWVNEALHDPGIGHKMMFFLHQFLAVSIENAPSPRFFDYLALLRWGSLGNFKRTVLKMIVDNGMLEYIDNNQNYVNNPNENFAREFFELHTIGKGEPAGPGDYTNFTEDDIVAAARVLTGFGNGQRHLHTDTETKLPTGRAFPQSHDFKPKIFSARFGGKTLNAPSNDADGMWKELTALVDMVFEQPETGRNLCRRLYRYFMRRSISTEVETDIIIPLAQTLSSGNFELKPVLERLLQSEHFFDEDDSVKTDETVGALIKPPLELTLQALSFFNVPIPDPAKDAPAHYMTFYNAAIIERNFDRAGLTLFYPPDVAGYPGFFQDPDYHRQFFNSATIVARYKLPQMLLTGTYAWGGDSSTKIGTQLNIAAWVKDSKVISKPEDSRILVRELLQYLFPEEADSARFDYFWLSIFLDKLPPADWTYEWEAYVKTGKDDEVKIPLSRLVNAVMYAPEYQLM